MFKKRMKERKKVSKSRLVFNNCIITAARAESKNGILSERNVRLRHGGDVSHCRAVLQE